MSSPPSHPPMSSIHLSAHTALPLYKQNSWSPDSHRDEAWLRQKAARRNRRSRSVTDEDLDELKACIELGFGFDSPEIDQRLSDTFPAYGLYYAVNKQYHDAVSKPPTSSAPLSPAQSEYEAASSIGSPPTIFGPGNPHPEDVSSVFCTRVDYLLALQPSRRQFQRLVTDTNLQRVGLRLTPFSGDPGAPIPVHYPPPPASMVDQNAMTPQQRAEYVKMKREGKREATEGGKKKIGAEVEVPVEKRAKGVHIQEPQAELLSIWTSPLPGPGVGTEAAAGHPLGENKERSAISRYLLPLLRR